MPESSSSTPDSFINKDDGRKYWQCMDASIASMVGVVPDVSEIDLRDSRDFLAQLGIGTGPGLRIIGSALDGGAGIGRVTQGLLVDVARQVDVMEPIAKFTEGLKGGDNIREILNIGLEEWHPTGDIKYDLIWNQWCLGHLTDRQLIQYLEECKTALEPKDGLIVVKENVTTSGVDLFDNVDSAVTRENCKFLRLFQQAGLQLVMTGTQRDFPKHFFPVKMYALKLMEA
ncbi:alpha-N-methyltransferase NTM1 [Xylariaceae sp. FL0662B]|nr:alpha-N-methyltransferase NTM1 [Xylariaceae sp. FL0662B]